MFKLFYLIIFSIFFTNSVFAKPLPPGTSTTLPANILFVVDKSQSMSNPADGGNNINAMRPPTDVVAKGDGNYFVSSIDQGGFYFWNASNRRFISDNNVFRGQYKRTHQHLPGIDNPIQIEYHEGTKRLYVLADQRGIKSHGQQGGVDCRGGGFIVYVIHTKVNSGTHRTHKGQFDKPNYKSQAALRLSDDGVSGMYNCKGPQDSYGRATAKTMLGNTAIAIHGNNLYIITGEDYQSNSPNEAAGMMVMDITKTEVYGFGRRGNNQTVTRCTNNLAEYKKFNEAFDIVTETDGSTTETVIYSKDSTGGSTKIYRAVLKADGCLNNTTVNEIAVDSCGASRGDGIVVKDKKIYTTGFYTHQICMYQSNGNAQASLIKKVGVNDVITANSTSDPNIYLAHPMGIDFGKGGAGEDNKLMVVSKDRLEIVMLNKDDLSYEGDFGNPGVSLLTGAKEAIKNVLSDSATLQQANFGILFWAKPDGDFRGFDTDINGNLDYRKSLRTTSVLCGGIYTCLDVGINIQGAQQVKDFFNDDSMILQYQTKTKGFRQILNRYFLESQYSQPPIGPYQARFKNCQTTALIIIGDGAFKDNNSSFNDTVDLIKKLYDDKGIITYTVGYGEEIATKPQTSQDVQRFIDLAKAGGTHDVADGKIGYYNALRPADLKTVTDQIVQNIISRNVVFSNPNIASEIEQSGELYQAKFRNRTNKEWIGTIIKTKLVNGQANTTNQIWNASEILKTPGRRNIWTALEGITGSNNFKDDAANLNKIRTLFGLQNNQITEYHTQTATGSISNSTRCKNTANIPTLDGTPGDEDVGLINFVRGEDYFDYNNNCNLSEERKRTEEDGSIVKDYLADIYNSSLVVVGSPNASLNDQNILTESYFRSKNNYETFKNSYQNRTEVIYGAANNGILHAFKTDDGSELWGFIPPLIVPKLPTIISETLNTSSGGGSFPKFLLDGSPIVHDTYFDHPTKSTGWYTLMMIPYGRAGAGFSLIDITDVNNPVHIYSILNDYIGQQVLRVDHDGIIHKYGYPSIRRDHFNFDETQAAINNGTIATGKIWNLPGVNINGTDTIVTINGEDRTSTTSFADNGSGGTRITFSSSITYNPNDTGPTTDRVAIVKLGNFTHIDGPKYDYRFLGETWASPRVFRMPTGPGDKEVLDDKYVAVLPGGYGNQSPGIGSNVYVLNWTTGELIKEIKISDKPNNNIVNSIPATPVVITADAVQGNYSGAMVYVNDLEGKITKINMTNLSGNFSFNPTTGIVSQGASTQNIQMFDQYTFFDLEATTVRTSSTNSNNRYMYHSMDAGIGSTTGNLWLFGATGDYLNLSDTGIIDPENNVKNVIFGIKDFYFPFFGQATTSTGNTIDTLQECKNMTGDTTSCDAKTKRGWYINLSGGYKVTAEPTFASGVAYYPIFAPVRNNVSCGSGDAYVCGIEAECGKNISSELDQNNSSSSAARDCFKVGTGVLSKVVVFGSNLYANISDESDNQNKTDIVVINAIDRSAYDFRNSWRENF